MIDDDSYVFVPFLITGLIDTDIYKVVEPAGTFRFYIIQGAVNASADGLPVDAHVFGYNTTWQINGKPSDVKIKIFGKATAGVCPWYISNKYAVIRTLYAMGIIGDLDKHCTPIQSSPCAWLRILLVVSPAPFMADGAIVGMPYIRSGVDADVINTIIIRVEFCVFYNCILDIE